jgi:hypothetical protein
MTVLQTLPRERDDTVEQPLGEPWGLRLWITFVAVVLIAACLDSYGIRQWPMADDEVPSLVEMGLYEVPGNAFSVPAVQLERLPKALPVWYAFQSTALRMLPRSEFGFRIPSLICAIIVSGLTFIVAARWRGFWFGLALALILNLSQPFVFLAQIDRFYSMPLLLLALTLMALWASRPGVSMIVATAVLTTLTVLSHNVTVAVFVLGFIAACCAYVVGRAPRYLVVRTAVAAAISVLLYFVMIKPLVTGWNSTGNPTPVLVSFAAHVGVPSLALAVLGMWLAATRRDSGVSMVWWGLVLVGTLCFMPVTSMSWNPRYFLFFMPPVWMLAAYAMERVAQRFEYRSAAAVWYCCVAALLLPSLVSHYRDGSRHDYRRAAAVLVESARDDQPILSDDAETISYYLPASLRSHLLVRTKVTTPPANEFFLVTRSNAWTALPQVPGRQLQLVSEIYTRRFDQFSHILRVYRIAAASPALDQGH